MIAEPVSPENEVETPAAVKRREPRLHPTFWNIASIVSLVVNVILIVVVLGLGANLFALKRGVISPLIDGLYGNFQLMDEAHIRTTIPVSASVPAKFDLLLDTDTVVVLTEDTYISNATVTVNTGGLFIQNAGADIVLPAGAQLPVHLLITVPVDQQIPVDLTVEVDIPLSQTELHQPFVGLQGVVAPYKEILDKLPSSWADVFKR